ncbi:sulfotransferase domain-containing protein [Winogradskyella aurantiaca]|uniref:sulfotransferase domain-containing protein n=1 Tax=Winogradskyella aurantiaca TaxID=2219558 RepID=UPI000E1D9DA9|nr:sulfotransferase domain-containing protein [Winogradskyella aurantiaca]
MKSKKGTIILELEKIYRKILNFKTGTTNQLFGYKDYHKFVIISTSRTGSTFLMSLLNKHPNIICEGEVFKKLNGKSCLNIWNSLFSKRPKSIKQVGFKLFYFHPYEDDQAVWDYLLKDKTIKIIHLKRKNQFRVYLSQRIGLKTKQWTESKYKPHNLSTQDKLVSIDVLESKKAIEEIITYENKTDSQFKEHSMHELFYEDLEKDHLKEIAQAYEFLKVPYAEVEVVNTKQNKETVKQLVSNFEELEKGYKNSSFEWMIFG